LSYKSSFPRGVVFALKIVLVAFFLFATAVEFWERPETWLARSEYLKLGLYLSIWFLCCLAIFSAAFAPYNLWRLAIAALLSASAGFGLAFYNISGNPADLTDVMILWDGRQDTTNALSFFLPKIEFPLLVAFVGFLGMALPGIAIRGKRFVGICLFVLLPIVPLALVFAILFTRPLGATASLPQQYVPIALWTTAIAIDQTAERSGPRLPVDMPRSDVSVPENIVLIVDESIAAGALSLNADHGVTPFLKDNAGSILNYGVTTSASNCSAFANLLLRVGASRIRFQESVRTWPDIWAYAGKANYGTSYLDGQREPGSLQNYMMPSELQTIDRVLQLGGLSSGGARLELSGRRYAAQDVDIAIADLIRDAVADDKRDFLYAVKLGSHFPYDDRYPADQAVYLPVMAGAGKNMEDRQSFLNSYKNAVRWSVDRFFAHFLPGLDLSRSVVIYTSDHGQAFLEGGRTQTHCSGQNPQMSEGLVPLLVLTEHPHWKRIFEQTLAPNFGQVSHFNIFPTLLQLMGYRAEAVSERYGPTLFEHPHSERAFSYGNVLGVLGRKPNWKAVPAGISAPSISDES
jgi:lipid A ethanolaminephosphotransferase